MVARKTANTATVPGRRRSSIQTTDPQYAKQSVKIEAIRALDSNFPKRGSPVAEVNCPIVRTASMLNAITIIIWMRKNPDVTWARGIRHHIRLIPQVSSNENSAIMHVC